MARRLGGQYNIQEMHVSEQSENSSLNGSRGNGLNVNKQKPVISTSKIDAARFNSPHNIGSSVAKQEKEPLVQREGYAADRQIEYEGVLPVKKPRIDITAIADMVYRMMLTDLALERDRGA
ncbi:hypothetical protein ACFLX5_01510 [Chloroflexota bacterium]